MSCSAPHHQPGSSPSAASATVSPRLVARFRRVVVKSGNCGVVPDGGVQHAAVGQLEACRCAQFTQAVSGVGR